MGTAGQQQTQPPAPPTPPASTPPQDAGQQQDTPQSFEVWLDGQPDTIKELYKGHTSGLKSALEKERESNKELTKQIKGLSSKMEEGSDAKKALDDIASKLDTESNRADFYEEASGKGVVDLKLAWLAVQAEAEDLIRKGRVNFDELKARHPQLFTQQQPVPRSNAGSGAGQQPGAPGGMNDFIRKAAGHK